MIFTDPAKAKAYIDRNSTAVCFEITIQRKKRSLPQNKYYWGAVLPLLGLEWGYTVEEMHQLLKGMFLAYEKNGYSLTKSTTELNTVEFEIYLSQIRKLATEHGVIIPLPNENLTELFNYLETNKNYLL